MKTLIFITAICLSGCLSDDDSSPVCQDVKELDSYCFIPLPANQDRYDTQCGFSSYGSCWDHIDPDGDNRGPGSCEAKYIWVTECTE